MGKWQALTLTGVAVLLSLMTWFSATAVLPELTSVHDLTAGQAAWLTNAVQLGFAVGALFASSLAVADVLPLTRYMAAAAALACVANALLLVDMGATGAIAARFLTGVALAGVYPPAMKLIATWFKTGRGIAMGAMVGALTLGSAMPHLVRGTGGMVAWEAVVLICSLGSAVAALLFGLVLREGPHAFARTRVSVRQVGQILRNGPVMLANLGYFGHMWELYAMWGWFLAYAGHASTEGIGAINVSLLTFAVIAAGAPGCLLGGWLAERIGRCRTTILMMGVSGVSALFIGVFFGGPTWAFATIALIWGFTVVADSAQFSAAVSELSEPHLVGSSLTFQMGVGFAITILTIWLTPLMAAWLGSWQWTFVLLAPGPLIGVISMYLLYRHPKSALMADGQR
ncbi:MFS transporter [Roseovarius phycicola]|uniref:MFS transporter n=1 Tax=Roseovarius phycicola TaxID=3080976 RepID=A0ABZ2HQ86_9RHOB